MVSRPEMQVIVADTGWRVRQFSANTDSYYIPVLEKDGEPAGEP
jgi:hypothetical protein